VTAPLAAVAVIAMVPRIVVVSDGVRTQMAFQSEQPWPLPDGVKREDAIPVAAETFDAIDSSDAPVMQEEWAGDPCPEPTPDADEREGGVWRRGAPPEEVPRPDRVAPTLPRSSTRERTTTPGLRVDSTTSARTFPIAVPVIEGQEVVIHVLEREWFGARDVPTLELPPTIDVPVALRGALPETYAALFARLEERTPGAVVVEGHQFAVGPGEAAAKTLGWTLPQAPRLTRLHVRPRAGTTRILLVPRDGHDLFPTFRVGHAWPGPVRCIDPDPNTWSSTPPLPASEPRATPDPGGARHVDVPELGLGRARFWSHIRAFDRGSLLGVGVGVALVVASRRRRPRRSADQGPKRSDAE
jgi:hypothetical protein